MSFSVYDASIPMLAASLASLESLIDKAAAHVAAKGIDPATLLATRLAPDMFALSRQIQSAADAGRNCAARLAGVSPPSDPDTETTFDELKARVAKTRAYVLSFEPSQIDGAEDRTITIPTRKEPIVFQGRDYLTRFAIPNFFFHISMTYAILRQQGVEIGKQDYLGS